MRPSAKLIICVALLVALAACGPTNENRDPASAGGVVFDRDSGGEPDMLEPHRNEEPSGAEIVRDLFEGLTTETVDAHIVACTAASWTTSDDGLVYTVSLRSDARWSNGDPVVAEGCIAGGIFASNGTRT